MTGAVNSEGEPGLSPRGRGNLDIAPPLVGHRRSIPAWAGEPPLPVFIHRDGAVYPRVGGGTVGALLVKIG